MSAALDTLAHDRHAVLDRLFEAFNRHDADAVIACFTPTIIFDAAAGPESCGRRFTGAAEVRSAFVGVWTSFPDVAWHVGRHTLAGDRAFTEWRFVATAADGGRIDVEGVDLFVFEGALIASKRAFRKERPVQPPQARAFA